MCGWELNALLWDTRLFKCFIYLCYNDDIKCSDNFKSMKIHQSGVLRNIYGDIRTLNRSLLVRVTNYFDLLINLLTHYYIMKCIVETSNSSWFFCRLTSDNTSGMNQFKLLACLVWKFGTNSLLHLLVSNLRFSYRPNSTQMTLRGRSLRPDTCCYPMHTCTVVLHCFYAVFSYNNNVMPYTRSAF